MDPNSLKTMAAAAGAAKGDPIYVDDVFSCDGYVGTGGTKNVNNGIDLSGEGGMVWFKARNAAYDHAIFDTERGAGYRLMPNNDGASTAEATGLTAFNSNGWTTGSSAYTNESGKYYAAFNFRKCPGFFDVVTWNGSGSLRTISHDLGCIPGMIIVKKTTDTGTVNWRVYHKHMDSSVPEEYFINFDEDGNRVHNASNSLWNDTQPTSSVFTVNTEDGVNASGSSYVAYLFADGADAGAQVFGENQDEAIIKCGTYEGNGGTQTIDFGFEPQFLILKDVDADRDWVMMSTATGWTADQYQSVSVDILFPNRNDAEYTGSKHYIDLVGTGLTFVNEGGGDINYNGRTYIYIAINRWPTRVPETATDVFGLKQDSGSMDSVFAETGRQPDLVITKAYGTGANAGYQPTAAWYVMDRLRRMYYLRIVGTGAQANDLWTSSSGNQWFSNGFQWNGNAAGSTDPSSWTGPPYVRYLWCRAPGFFDIVYYKGNSTSRNIPHKLGVAPEFIMNRSLGGGNWFCQSKYIPADNILYANSNWGKSDNDLFNDTYATSEHVAITSDNDINHSSYSYIMYLFASCPGISKLGGYEGTGSAIDVDCGFSGGARFVMIKRHDGTGDWQIFDTGRGIVAGNDSRHKFNSIYGHDNSTDYIDPLTGGFTVAAQADVNTDGHNYIYMAIA